MIHVIPPLEHSFASDNFSGCHPEIIEALTKANTGHAPAYGDDPWTAALEKRIREVFGETTRVFPVFGGTGANVVSLSLLVKSFEAVLCTDSAHIAVDECGAPEGFLGIKLVPVKTQDGKLTVELISRVLTGVGVQHHVQPRVVSITQSTELGTVYTPGEIRKITDFAHRNNLFVHMDGARLANAAASLGCSLKEMTSAAGIDVLSFGGTKNGLLGAEAVICFEQSSQSGERFADALYRRKQAMQLPSKSRFVSAQLLALFESDLWLRSARHSNEMARQLAGAIAEIKQIEICYPTQANAVFAKLSPAAIQTLQKQFKFYVWDESQSIVRWMTSFDTRPEHIESFARAIRAACS